MKLIFCILFVAGILSANSISLKPKPYLDLKERLAQYDDSMRFQMTTNRDDRGRFPDTMTIDGKQMPSAEAFRYIQQKSDDINAKKNAIEEVRATIAAINEALNAVLLEFTIAEESKQQNFKVVIDGKPMTKLEACMYISKNLEQAQKKEAELTKQFDDMTKAAVLPSNENFSDNFNDKRRKK